MLELPSISGVVPVWTGRLVSPIPAVQCLRVSFPCPCLIVSLSLSHLSHCP